MHSNCPHELELMSLEMCPARHPPDAEVGSDVSEGEEPLLRSLHITTKERWRQIKACATALIVRIDDISVHRRDLIPTTIYVHAKVPTKPLYNRGIANISKMNMYRIAGSFIDH